MATGEILNRVVRQLRQRCGDGPADGDLLTRFAEQRDESAFAELVGRHGALVLGVARRHVPDRQAAEDVVQATFLALARNAKRLGDSSSLVNWLYVVALRQARKARLRFARGAAMLQRLPPPGAVVDPLAEVSGRELVTIIDDELSRLPAVYRLPLLLCALEGLSREEAARRLSWPVGSVKGRLERGREVLRRRLAKRGLTVPAVLAGGLLTAQAEAMPAGLVTAVTRAAVTTPATALPLKLIAAAIVVMALGAGVAIMPGDQPTTKPNQSAKATALVPQLRVDAEGLPLPPDVLARFGSSRMRHSSGVYRVEYAPDGRSLVSASTDGIRIWNVSNGKPLGFIPSVDNVWPLTVQPSNGGRELLTFWRGEKTAHLKVLDVPTGREMRRVDVPAGYVQSATLSPSGRLVAVVWPFEKAVRVIDTTAGKELARIETTGNVSRGMAFTPNDKTLAIAQLGGPFQLYDTATGMRTAELKPEGQQGLFITFSPNGRMLATLTVANNGVATDINLWDVANGTHVRRIGGPDVQRVDHVAFSPDGKLIAQSSQQPDVILWETATGREVRRLRCWPSSRATAFSPDGTTLGIAHGDGTITQWDVTNGKLLPASADPIISVYSLRFTAGGRRLIGGADSFIAWDSATGAEVRRYGAPPVNRGPLVLSPDEQLIATTRPNTAEPAIDLWNASTGELVRSIAGKKPFWPAGFTPDGRRIVASDTDREIHVFAVASGEKLGTLTGHSGWPSRLVVSPDGRRLASATGAGRGQDFVRLWDLDAFREIGRLEARGLALFDMAFSPDGRLLATAGGTNPGRTDDRGEIRIWDAESGREVRSIAGIPQYADCVTFSPDGKTIAAAAPGSPFRLWETATGAERHRFIGHTGDVHAIAFSPDGRTVAASSPDAPVYLWDVYGRSAQPPRADDLNQCWSNLAGADATAAFRSIRRLVNAPEAAVALLRDRLKPLPAADAAKVKKWIGHLDSPKFAERQSAAKELEAVADRAADQLRAALVETKSAEVRRALQAIVERLDAPTPEMLRSLRAVEVLEQIATPPAREHLRSLSEGAAGATLARAAADALKRLPN